MEAMRERLITEHLYIVAAEAGKYHRKCPAIPLEDHYQAGALGLMKAAERYDPSRGFAFKTLAGWWIRGEIRHQIRGWNRAVRSAPAGLEVRLLSLDELRPTGLHSDGDTMLDSLPCSVDVEEQALDALGGASLEAAIVRLPEDWAAAVREVALGGQTWQAFGTARGWTPARTARFAESFRRDVGPMLRSRPEVADWTSGGVVEIPLRNGGRAKVDRIDRPRVEGAEWSRDPRGFGYRIIRRPRSRRRILLHHAIVGTVPPGHRVLHRNGDRLDCRRSNLVVIPRWMAYHRGGARNRTGYRGVYFDRRLAKWCARLMANGERVFLGGYGSPKAAALAYDQAARERIGSTAKLNFPDEACHA